MLYLSDNETLLSFFYGWSKEAYFSSSCWFLAVAFIFMTYCGSHFLVIAKKYVFTMIVTHLQLKSPAWVVLHCPVPLPPLHTSHMGFCQALACCARRLPAPGPSLPCSGVQDWVQPACFTSHYQQHVCCPANPSNASEAAMMRRGFLFQLQVPFSPRCARQKGKEQWKLSSTLVMIRSALFMISWFKCLAGRTAVLVGLFC